MGRGMFEAIKIVKAIPAAFELFLAVLRNPMMRSEDHLSPNWPGWRE